jgi:hypothetical protein
MTKARTIADLGTGFVNISDTGTEGTKVASGTTAQRGSTTGQLRFNTETNVAEYYDGTEFKAIDAPPTITSVDVTNVETDLGGTETFVITGSLFNGSSTVKFRDNGGTLITPDTTTVNSASQITVTKTRSSFSNANEPYDVIVTNPSGLGAVLDDQINVDNTPTWTTASGNVASILDTDTSNHATLVATDPDGDTISYSETGGTNLSTAGLTLNSSTGIISGDPTNLVSGSTTYNFTARATAGSKFADRNFNIIVAKQDGTTEAGAVSSGATLLSLGKSAGNYWFKTGSAPAYQAYYTTDDGGGWTPLCSFSNFVSKYQLWFSDGSTVPSPNANQQPNVDTRISVETSAGTATSLTKNSFKVPAFWEFPVNKLLFKVNLEGSTGFARYEPNANQTMKYMMLNRTSTDSRVTSSGTVEPMIGSIYWRNSLANDGGYMVTALASSEACGGIITLVDGAVYSGEDNGWNGNITRTTGGRTYSQDGTTTDHTIWVYGKV